jgi:hypothetical protein
MTQKSYTGMSVQEQREYLKKIDEAQTLEEVKEIMKELIFHIYWNTRSDYSE